MSDLMSVHLHLGGVRVRRVLVDTVDRLEVEVESAREWWRCPHCGFRAYHSCRRASRGPIEGINNLLQVLRRVAHGFTNTDNFAARGLLVT